MWGRRLRSRRPSPTRRTPKASDEPGWDNLDGARPSPPGIFCGRGLRKKRCATVSAELCGFPVIGWGAVTEPAEKKLEQRETALQLFFWHVHVFVCLCVFARCYVVYVLGRWGPDTDNPSLCKAWDTRQHLPPSRVGGADRPKGRESRRAGARKSGRHRLVCTNILLRLKLRATCSITL